MNVVAVFVILFSMIPVYFAQRLTRDRDDEPGHVVPVPAAGGH